MNAPPRHNLDWTRDEQILALYLYCQTPFARTKANNPEVVRLAALLGRTPASVARKLGNFGAFDPLLAARGVSGLTHASRADRVVWDEFDQNWPALIDETQRIEAERGASVVLPDEPEIAPSQPAGTQRLALRVERRGQQFFRRAVLASYEGACCVCTLDLSPLLVGSHIVPWAAGLSLRMDPRNGLCLCALHDRAFDRGLMTVEPGLTIRIARAVARSRSDFARTTLLHFEGAGIRPPRRFAPLPDGLAWHGAHVFQG